MTILQGSVTALATFMFINSITPGPNNLMLLQGGLKKGYWGCRHHMLGIAFGVGIMLWLSYWGIASVVVAHPIIMLVIQVLGTGYLLWLAYHMAKSDFSAIVEDALDVDGKKSALAQQMRKQRFGELPLTFWQAAVFQWLNPKAWTMTMLAPPIAFIHSTEGLGYGLANLPLLLMSILINLSSISFWAAGGQSLRRLIHQPKLMRAVQIVIVIMVVYCAVALWLS